MTIVIRAIPKVAIPFRYEEVKMVKKTHQKSYDEGAGEMLMPVNQINQIYQLRRVCWNHFSFFFHHFFLILIQPTSKRYDHYKYQFLMGFRMVYVSRSSEIVHRNTSLVSLVPLVR